MHGRTRKRGQFQYELHAQGVEPRIRTYMYTVYMYLIRLSRSCCVAAPAPAAGPLEEREMKPAACMQAIYFWFWSAISHALIQRRVFLYEFAWCTQTN